MERSNRDDDRAPRRGRGRDAAHRSRRDDLARAGATLHGRRGPGCLVLDAHSRPERRPLGAGLRSPRGPVPHRRVAHVLGVTYAADEARARAVPPARRADRHARRLAAREPRRVRLPPHAACAGSPIPGHITFPEINLRFYVRLGGERAVVFIREFVPRPAISLVAKLAYNEPYRTTRMEQVSTAARDALRRPPSLRPAPVEPRRGDGEPRRPPCPPRTRPSTGSRITTSASAARAAAPRAATASSTTCGRCTRSLTLDVDVDFERLYGPQWAHLADAEPSHVTLATGSEVRVLGPGSA